MTKSDELACIHHLFMRWVRDNPDHTALSYEGNHLTYRELNSRANRVANRLLKNGVAPEGKVGLCADRSLGMIIGLVGILKAGGAYVPLDPVLPKSRLSHILDDSGAHPVLTYDHLRSLLPDDRSDILSLDATAGTFPDEGDHEPPDLAQPENLAYVIYTSGSTGQPKGVMIEHRQLYNYVSAIQIVLDLNGALSFATVSTLSADLGNTSIFPALCLGGTLHVISQSRILDAERLAQYCDENSIDVLKITPSHLEALLGATKRPTHILPRRALVLGGEALRWDLVHRIRGLGATCAIFNHYGPTETTIGAIVYPLNDTAAKPTTATVPLGRPIANVRVYVVDESAQPAPIGVAGELLIGGYGVGRGYLNRPDLTHEKFIADRLGRQDGRLYRTGDLTRRLPDGNIEFLGRIDDQVKIRGNRVEVGEVQEALSRHPHVRNCVVLAQGAATAERRLIAYLVCDPQRIPSIFELRSFLEQRLASYMIPAEFIFLDRIPLTPNGKIDREKLAGGKATYLSDVHVKPRTPIESGLLQIWQDILSADWIGVEDNFFLVGGHSLLAIRVINSIREKFGVDVSVASIFEAPTITAMAEVIQRVLNQPTTQRLSPDVMEKLAEIKKFVLTLQEGDPGQFRPVFAFHPPIGAIAYMINLVRHLSKDQPFFGVQCPAYEGVRPPLDQIEEMAEYYFDAIRLIQPEGPYLLLGHSSGAYIAYEMALQLQAKGMEAPLVMVVDEVAPCLTGDEPEHSIMDVLRAENVHESVEAMFVTAWLVGLAHGKKLTFTADELRPLPNDKRYELVANFLKQAGFIPENAKPEIVGTILEMYRNHSRADDAYKEKFTKQPPNPLYEGQLALFRCTEPTTYEGTDAVTPPDTSAYSSWDKFCSEPVDVIGIPNANHITIIMEPCVKVMANQIERYLRRFAKIGDR